MDSPVRYVKFYQRVRLINLLLRISADNRHRVTIVNRCQPGSRSYRRAMSPLGTRWYQVPGPSRVQDERRLRRPCCYFLVSPPRMFFLGLLAAKILMAIGFPPLKGKIANQLFLNSTKPTDLGYHPFIDCLVSGFVYPFLEWNMDVLPRKKRHLRSAGFITSTYQVMSRMISPLMWVKQQ